MIITIQAGDEWETPIDIKVKGTPTIVLKTSERTSTNKGGLEITFSFSDFIHMIVEMTENEKAVLTRALTGD